ncbi:MAG: hypothetical protein WCT03_16120 [Candidatus Obscuribacterales bacterium]|jgi:hypothetical protein
MSQAKQVTEPTSERKRPLHNVFEEQITVHPLVPLARAATILRIDPILLKERLASGQIKGEQRSDSDPGSRKNSWFIYASEFNRLLNDQLTRYENRISTEGMDKLFEAKAEQSKKSEPSKQPESNKTFEPTLEQEVVADADVQFNFSVNSTDEVIHIEIKEHTKQINQEPESDSELSHDQSESALQLIGELASKLEAATYRNGYLEALLEVQAEQIKLLPDLQAQAEKTLKLEAELEQLRQQAVVKKTWLGSLANWLSNKAE